MANTKAHLIDMFDSLNQEKRNINQLFLTSAHTITELHKTDAFIEQLKAIIFRLNQLLQEHGKLKNSKNFNIENKEYSKIVNLILAEYRFLLSTNEAMNENLNEINRTEGIQTEISGRMIQLQKDIDKVIRKINKVLKLQSEWN